MFRYDRHPLRTLGPAHTPPSPMPFPQGEKSEKKRKGGKVSAFFRRLWKAVKRPFLRSDQCPVVQLSPSDTDSSEDTSGPNIFRILAPTHTDSANSELGVLPGQVCKEPVVGTLPAPPKIQQTFISNLAPPQSEFHRSVKSEKFSADLEALPGPSRILPDESHPVLECLPGQIDEDLWSFSSSKISYSDQRISPWIFPRSCSSVVVPDEEPTEQSFRRKRSGLGAKVARFFFRHGQDRVQHLCPGKDRKHLDVPQESGRVPLGGFYEADLSASSSPGLKYGSFVCGFQVGFQIGRGGFGEVHEGFYKDHGNRRVAIKHVQKNICDRYVEMDGFSKPVMAEVACLLKLGTSCPNIVQLHQWFENENSLLLIMEYPAPCQTLLNYLLDKKFIDEDRACCLMQQLLMAVKHCNAHGVYHGDLHGANILVTEPGLQLKIIDFGLGAEFTRGPILSAMYEGASEYAPPEIFQHQTFFAGPAYVWGVGVILYLLMHIDVPFKNKKEVAVKEFQMDTRLSAECCDLIYQCLVRDPAARPSLEDLEEHIWFRPLRDQQIQKRTRWSWLHKKKSRKQG